MLEIHVFKFSVLYIECLLILAPRNLVKVSPLDACMFDVYKAEEIEL